MRQVCDSAFSECGGLSGLAGLTNAAAFSERAFFNCQSVGGPLVLPAATSIGRHAFYHCAAITDVEAPLLADLGAGAFAYCENLGSASFANLAVVQDGAFRQCIRLSRVRLSPSLLSVGECSFEECALLGDFSPPLFPEGFRTLGFKSFRLCGGSRELPIVFPRSLVELLGGDWSTGAAICTNASIAFAGMTFDSCDLSASRLHTLPAFIFSATWNRIDLPRTLSKIEFCALAAHVAIPASAPLRRIYFHGAPPEEVDPDWAGTNASTDWKMAVYVPSDKVADWRASEGFVDKDDIEDISTLPHYADVEGRHLLGAWRNKWCLSYTPPDSPTLLLVK